jgi:phosphoglycolate phosphatase (TIGR01487 family)
MRTRKSRPSRLRGLVTDVDGTLTDRDRRLDPEAVEWLRRLSGRGVQVMLATGNVLPIALALHRSIGLSGPIIAEDGGILYRKEGRREIVERIADQRPALTAYHRLRRAGLPVERLFTDRWRETEVALVPSVSPVRIRPYLRGLGVRVESTGFAHHLIQKDVGKLSTLVRALRPLGLAPEDCLIAGDGDNDVEMLRAAGWGVSFSSASRRARDAADLVARAGYSRGFVEAIKASRGAF